MGDTSLDGTNGSLKLPEPFIIFFEKGSRVYNNPSYSSFQFQHVSVLEVFASSFIYSIHPSLSCRDPNQVLNWERKEYYDCTNPGVREVLETMGLVLPVQWTRHIQSRND